MGYEHKLNAYFKRHWLRGLFAWCTYRRISHLKTAIKELVAETTPGDKEQEPKGKVGQTLLFQIQSLFSTVEKKLKDKEPLVDFLYSKLAQIDAWREQSGKLSFKESRKVYKSIFALEKKLHLEANEQWFRIQQKKDIEETKRLLEQVKIELNKIKEEFNKKINLMSGYENWFHLSLASRITAFLAVAPLKQTRFFKLSPKDSKSPDAVDVSCEIDNCIKLSQQLESSMHLQTMCRLDLSC